MNVNELAEKLSAYAEENQNESDLHIALEAVWLSEGEGASLEGKVESFSAGDGDWLYVLLPDEEGGETVGVLDGRVYRGTIDGMVAEINEEYCKKNGLHACIHCGEFNKNSKHVIECDGCEKHTTDSDAIDEPHSILKGFEVVEDGDYEFRLLQTERIPTHETKSRQTMLFVKLEYTDHWGDDCDFKYHMSIVTVNPSMAGKKGLIAAARSWGIEEEDIPKDKLQQAEILLSYGTYATLWQESGSSKTNLFKQANEELQKINMLAGFYLDKAQNAIGTDGWDFMRGKILGGLGK
jgi:hypothetical protein